MVKIFITGINGFIGSELKRSLESQDHIVSGCDFVGNFDEVKVFDLDINDREKLSSIIQKIQPEVIINCAAETHIDSDELSEYQTNTLGVENVLYAIDKAVSVKKLFHFSSMLVYKYGSGKSEPDTCYGLSKKMGEDLITNFTKMAGSDIAVEILRPSSVLGSSMTNLGYRKFNRIVAIGILPSCVLSFARKPFVFVSSICEYISEKIQFQNCQSQAQIRTAYCVDCMISLGEYAQFYADSHNINLRFLPFPLQLLKPVAILHDFISNFININLLSVRRLHNITNSNDISQNENFTNFRNLTEIKKLFSLL